MDLHHQPLSWASRGYQLSCLCPSVLIECNQHMLCMGTSSSLMSCRVNYYQVLHKVDSSCRKKDELIHTEAAKKAGIEVIKRFSGGGTVVVDHNTVFATLIMQAEAVPGVECHPRPIMQWSEGFYKNVFGPHGNFSLREHGETAPCLIVMHHAPSSLIYGGAGLN